MTWFVQTALGLHYMHSHRVLHRDIKTQNVFILSSGRVVLGDLGISKVGNYVCVAQQCTSACCPCSCLQHNRFFVAFFIRIWVQNLLCTVISRPRGA